jgi:hypothetical protein
MTDTDDLITLIADRTGFDHDEITTVLTDQQIPRRRVLPTRNRLRVRTVHFAGVKNLRDDAGGENESRRLEPFSFTQQVGQDVFAFASSGTNDAGKSTVLETILWAVRGTSRTAMDVRVWMRHAIVEITIGADTFLVAWQLHDGHAKGLIVQRRAHAQAIDWEDIERVAMSTMVSEVETGERPGRSIWDDLIEAEVAEGAVIGPFDGDDAFKVCVGDFMNSRFGFEEAGVFTKNRKATDPLDGHITTHGWPLWSQALRIPDGDASATIGEATQNTALLLEMYLGTTWGPTANAAKARKNIIEGNIGTLRRRQAAEDEHRAKTIGDLESQLTGLRAERASLPDVADIDAYDQDLADMADTVTAVAAASTAYTTSLTEQLAAHQALGLARAAFIAAEEAEVTKRFWHSLKPTCCPRCDEPVDEERWARENEGSCSLCNADLAPEDAELEPAHTLVDTATESDDLTDEIEVARQRVVALEAEVIIADEALNAAQEARSSTSSAHAAVLERSRNRGGDVDRVRNLDRQIAILEGRIEERGTFAVAPAGLEAEERIVTVLAAAEKVAADRTKTERADLLVRVSEDITVLARRLGFHQLDKADFKANTHLPVVKGGAPAVSFSQCTLGEKLRLKIAVVIALLRNGTAAGVGRHPGLLVIDQITGEELNPVNGRQLLTELLQVASETGLQVIVGSANGSLMLDTLGAERVRTTRDTDDLLW